MKDRSEQGARQNEGWEGLSGKDGVLKMIHVKLVGIKESRKSGD